MSETRRIVRYRNRKLYEAKERRFVTLLDLAKAVSLGDRVHVVAADSGEDITARVLSRALASSHAPVAASADTLARLLRAGSEAAETVAGAVERVGGARMAATLRQASRPERLGKTLEPLTRRFEDARQDLGRLVAREIRDLKTRLAQLESLARNAFPPSAALPRTTSRRGPSAAARPKPNRKKRRTV